MHIDIHQHFWTEPLIDALSRRRELPFVRSEHGLTVLYLAGERPFVLDLSTESFYQRASLVGLDGLDLALLCLSSPLGIESLPRALALPLLDAYHDGAFALGAPFGVWGAVALDAPDPADVDRLLDRGCVGVSLPAGALAGVESHRAPASFARALGGARCAAAHPSRPRPGLGAPARAMSLAGGPPLVACPHALRLRHARRLACFPGRRPPRPSAPACRLRDARRSRPVARRATGFARGPAPHLPDPLAFYDTSSYGLSAIRALADLVGPSPAPVRLGPPRRRARPVSRARPARL